MRVAMVVALAMLAACASERLALAPPSGVDLSGRWQLNVEESDDPLHLIQSQVADPAKAARSQGQGGQGGPGGGRSGGPGGEGGAGGRFGGPSLPAVGALSQGLHWPGRDVEIKQVAGVVAMSSAGVNQVYQPTSGNPKSTRRPPPEDDPHARGRSVPGLDRNMRARDRDGPPAVCGWEGRTLVIQAGEPDDDHPPFEERYNISDDGQRLIEVVGFKGGRAEGFSMSRVWDRVPAAPATLHQ